MSKLEEIRNRLDEATSALNELSLNAQNLRDLVDEIIGDLYVIEMEDEKKKK